MRSIADFRQALDRALREGVVHYIFHLQPADWPDFLPRSIAGRRNDANVSTEASADPSSTSVA